MEEKNTVPKKIMYKVRYRTGTIEDTVLILAGSPDEAEDLMLDDHPGATILDVRKAARGQKIQL